ncbi:hypothetical protein E8E14_006252 [Neopestalotiopsis sp. 37M]|nr:hypothetical protein E8E14_006252 [Neopestalotiopsis sp. 37M]
MLLETVLSDKTVLGLSALGGVLFHHVYARRVEVDFMALRLIGVAIASCFLMTLWFINVWNLSLLTALSKLGLSVSAFLISLTSSILIYRGFFHRLRNVPGPFAARFSAFWTVKQSSGEYKFHRKLHKWHREHGDVVRIAPRMITVNRADAVVPLMALGKGVWWSHQGNDHSKLSFSLSRLSEDHKQRRRPWEQAFSTPTMDKFDADIQEIIGDFLRKLNVQGTLDVPAEMGRLSFDIMALVGFGNKYGTMVSGVSHPALVAMRKAHYAWAGLRWVPWLMGILSALPGGGSDFVPFLALCASVVRERQIQHKADRESGKEDSQDRKDVMSHLLDAMEQGGPSAPPSQEAMDSDSRVMIAAGADTTQSVLANCLWFMAAAPSATAKLQQLLDTLFPQGPESFSYATLIANKETIEWVDAIINETLRIRPAGISGNPRTTGPEGLIIPESKFGPQIYIPGDIDVLAPTWVLHRDERFFERATEFIPERWSPDSKLKCEKDAFFPFNIGKHACVGKPLALREVRSVVARVAFGFDLKFPPGTNWQAYEETIMDAFTMALPPFDVVFTPRVR